MSWLLLAAAAAAQISNDDRVEYAVKPGDTLSEFADRYIVPEHDWRDLQRIWRIRDPRRLPARTTLTIPRSWLRWTPETAEVVGARGTVMLKANGRTGTLSVGVTLREGAQVSTAANSFVTLELSNGSRIALPSESQVTVVRLRKYLINSAIDYRFRLERGRIDTKAAPLTNPSGNVIINTPLAMTAVRGTEYTVAFDPDLEITGTGVLEGAVAVSGLDGGMSELVPERFGALTDAHGKSRTVKLLPAPELKNPERIQTEDLVTFDLTSVPGALGYHVLLAADAGFIESYDEEVSTSPHVEFSDVPNGNQFVRISAIGEGGLRGMRQAYSFSRRLASIGADVGETEDGFVFRWSGRGEGERHYRLQIFRDAPEGTPLVDEVGLTTNDVTVRNLPPGVYFWRVALFQSDSEGMIENWTEPEELRITGSSGD